MVITMCDGSMHGRGYAASWHKKLLEKGLDYVRNPKFCPKLYVKISLQWYNDVKRMSRLTSARIFKTHDDEVPHI